MQVIICHHYIMGTVHFVSTRKNRETLSMEIIKSERKNNTTQSKIGPNNLTQPFPNSAIHICDVTVTLILLSNSSWDSRFQTFRTSINTCHHYNAFVYWILMQCFSFINHGITFKSRKYLQPFWCFASNHLIKALVVLIRPQNTQFIHFLNIHVFVE